MTDTHSTCSNALEPPRRMNVVEFAQDQMSASGRFDLAQLSRLSGEQVQETPKRLGATWVQWSLNGQSDLSPTPSPSGELHAHAHKGKTTQVQLRHLGLWVQASTQLVLQCQRCLAPMTCDLGFERLFRFAADEASALALDDEMEDDVLVAHAALDAFTLIEDELIMALPLVPLHEACPVSLAQHLKDGGQTSALEEKVNPFAVLAQLKTKAD